ncbi:hypothetical protein PanWU01x14_108690, partial [Parasponia andersonii]
VMAVNIGFLFNSRHEIPQVIQLMLLSLHYYCVTPHYHYIDGFLGHLLMWH